MKSIKHMTKNLKIQVPRQECPPDLEVLKHEKAKRLLRQGADSVGTSYTLLLALLLSRVFRYEIFHLKIKKRLNDGTQSILFKVKGREEKRGLVEAMWVIGSPVSLPIMKSSPPL